MNQPSMLSSDEFDVRIGLRSFVAFDAGRRITTVYLTRPLFQRLRFRLAKLSAGRTPGAVAVDFFIRLMSTGQLEVIHRDAAAGSPS